MSQPWGGSGSGGRQGPGCPVWRSSDWSRVHTLTHSTHTHSHTPTQAFTHIHSTHPPTHTHHTLSTHTHSHTHLNSHIHSTHTHTYTHSHIHSNSHVHSTFTHTVTPTHTNHTHTTPTHTHTHTHILKPALSWGTGWREGQGRAGGRSLAPLRSVYLHNNQLSNAGLPPDAFRGSEAVATLSLSSNQLSYVPPSLPPSLERLHLQVPPLRNHPHIPTPLRALHLHPGGLFVIPAAPAGAPSARPPPRPHSPRGPSPLSWGTPCHPSNQKCLWVLSSGMGAHGLSLSSLAQKNTLCLAQEPPWLPTALSPGPCLILFSLPRTTSSPRCPEEP